MPLFKSLRSKSSSRKSNAPVIGKNDSSTDFGPRSPSSTPYGSVKSTKNVVTKDTPTVAESQPVKKEVKTVPPSPPSMPRQNTSPSLARGNQESNGTKDSKMVRSLSAVSYATSIGEDGSAKPRPSELFAGKGVQWGAVKLAGPNVTPSPVAGTNNSEDMQNFLKMRRQWKPTFATEEDSKSDSNFQPPKDLTQLSFASGDSIQSQGLMSLKDLDESHQRKERLLSAAPLGGSLWDEAETSKAASDRWALTKPSPSPSSTNNGARPSNVRDSSFMSEKISKNGKGVIGVQKAAASQAIPVKLSSTVKAKEVEDNSVSMVAPKEETAASKPVEESVETTTKAQSVEAVPTTEAPTSTDNSGLPPPITATHLEGNNPAHPAESAVLPTEQGETAQDSLAAEDADKTLTANEGEKLAVKKNSSIDQTIPTELQQSHQTPMPQVAATTDGTIL